MSIASTDLVSLFSSLDLFRGIDSQIIKRVADVSQIVTFSPDSVVFQEGEKSSGTAYVILEGLVSVTIENTEVAILGPGSILGEYALINEADRSATVTVFEDELICATIGSEMLFQILDEGEVLAEQIMARMKQNMKKGLGMFAKDDSSWMEE